MTIYFSLTRGMKDEDFINAIRGKVSGEGRGQVLTFMHDSVEDALRQMQQMAAMNTSQANTDRTSFLSNILRNLARFNVLEINTEKQVALVSKTMIEYDQFNQHLIYYDYYVVGTNDEGSYFVHPVNGYLYRSANSNFMQDQRFKPEVTGIPMVAPIVSDHGHYIMPGTIEDIMRWVNRHDMNFKDGDRVQGDLLVKLFKYTDSSGAACSFGSNLYVYKSGKDDYYNVFGSGADKNPTRKYRSEGDSASLFNNHQLKTDGKVFQTRFNDLHLSRPFAHRQSLATLVVDASALVLEHEDHKTYTAHTPNGWMAMIVRQRGELLQEGMERASD